MTDWARDDGLSAGDLVIRFTSASGDCRRRTDLHDDPYQDRYARGFDGTRRRRIPPMANDETREMRQGFGDAFAAAFELAVTPAIFGFLGWLLDGRLGTTPIFTIVFTVVTLAYASYRLAHSYGENLELARAERRAAWQAEGPLL